MNSSSHYIHSLTPLRGIAALWVVVYHFQAITVFLGMAPLLPAETSGLIARGHVFVDFFFILSGFIITHVYGEYFTKDISRAKVLKYMSARFFRLYPLHLFCLAVLVVFYLSLLLLMPKAAEVIKAFFDWAALPVYLLMGQSMGVYPGLAWNVPSWSIAAEWWTYLIAIFLFPVLNVGKNWRTWLAMGVSVFGLWLLITLHEKHTLDITYDFGILRCLFSFVIGMGLYQLYKAGTCEGLLDSTTGFLMGVVLVLLALHSPISDLWILPAFSLLILSTAYNKGKVQDFLNTRPLQYLGNISYSVYMMQALWLFMFWALFGAYKTQNNIQDIAMGMKLVWLFGILLLNILSAALTYHFIEIPSREKLRKAMAQRYVPTPEKV